MRFLWDRLLPVRNWGRSLWFWQRKLRGPFLQRLVCWTAHSVDTPVEEIISSPRRGWVTLGLDDHSLVKCHIGHGGGHNMATFSFPLFFSSRKKAQKTQSYSYICEKLWRLFLSLFLFRGKKTENPVTSYRCEPLPIVFVCLFLSFYFLFALEKPSENPVTS